MKNHLNISTDFLNKERSRNLQLPFIFDPIQEVDNLMQVQNVEITLKVLLKLRFHGFDYIQVCRTERTALYHQTYDGKTVGYEVFIIHIQPETTLYGKFYPAHERWPKDGYFGKTAWSCFTIEEAMQKFNDLEKTKININILQIERRAS